MLMTLHNQIRRLGFSADAQEGIKDHLTQQLPLDDQTLVGNAWVVNQIQMAQFKGSYHHNGGHEGILYAYSTENNILWIKKTV
jgi:hypothetical protein